MLLEVCVNNFDNRTVLLDPCIVQLGNLGTTTGFFDFGICLARKSYNFSNVPQDVDTMQVDGMNLSIYFGIFGNNEQQIFLRNTFDLGTHRLLECKDCWNN
jgi:hypothetical protein